LIPSVSRPACAQSAAVPSVIKIRIGIPCASTARCILVLSPLLSGSSPDCHPPLPPRVDAPLRGWRQSSATRNPVHRSRLPTVSPRCPCPASGKNVVALCSSSHSPAASPAKAHPCEVSRIPRSEIAGCLARSHPTFPCSRSCAVLSAPTLRLQYHAGDTMLPWRTPPRFPLFSIIACIYCRHNLGGCPKLRGN